MCAPCGWSLFTETTAGCSRAGTCRDRNEEWGVSDRRAQVWAGVDAGKGHHWAAVVDETGATVWSKKIDNDETAILTAIGEIMNLAEQVSWAVDISGTASALLLALLAAYGLTAVYVPGRTV